MLVLDFCCYCITLRTGCLILGYLNLIVCIIYAIFLILPISTIVIAMVHLRAYDKGAALMILNTLLLLFIIIFLAFTIALLCGLHQEKPGHVKAYLIYGLVFLIINTIELLFMILRKDAREPVEIVINIVIIAYDAYFLLVVNSHYVSMLETNYYNAPYFVQTTTSVV